MRVGASLWLLGCLLSASLSSVAPLYDGHFVIQREPSSCSSISVSVEETSITVQPNCLVYDARQLRQAFHYVTYTKAGDPQEYQLRMATLSVEGHFGGHNLSFHCPGRTYYGTPPMHCADAPGMQLAVLHVGADNKLYEVDVFLTPAEYPLVEELVANQPPFGMARFAFAAGIPLDDSHHFHICKEVGSVECKEESRPLPSPLPSNVGVGTFSLAEHGLTADSVWIVDGANELLVATSGDRRYFFNREGFHYSADGTCEVHTYKNFAGQLNAYDSRFLDYAGTITIVSHYGYSTFKPVRVTMWVGVAFDAAKVDPVILYLDEDTGFYRGMDALDATPPPAVIHGASFWNDAVAPTIPSTSVLAFANKMKEAGDPCAAQFTDWLHPKHPRTCPAGLVLDGGLCRVPADKPALQGGCRLATQECDAADTQE